MARVSPARPATPGAPGGGPLHGVRILSFGAFVAGNSVAAILGQLGADVVKIEPRERPEVLGPLPTATASW